VYGIAGRVKILEATIFKPVKLIVVQVNQLPCGGKALQDLSCICALIRLNPQVNVAGRSKPTLRIEPPDRPALEEYRSDGGSVQRLHSPSQRSLVRPRLEVSRRGAGNRSYVGARRPP